MELVNVLKYILAIDCVVIVVMVILQTRSGGLGAVFGGGGAGEYRSKRGTEAMFYNLTIIAGVVFGVVSLAIAVLST